MFYSEVLYFKTQTFYILLKQLNAALSNILFSCGRSVPSLVGRRVLLCCNKHVFHRQDVLALGAVAEGALLEVSHIP